MKWEFINHLEHVYDLLDHLDREISERDYPIAWERIHATSCAQIGRLLAEKRGIDQELAALACSLHDIGRWYTGRQVNHARHGEEPLSRFLGNQTFPDAMKEEIIQAVIHHSEKENIGAPLEELVKDADILDCYLHGDEIKKPFHLARLENLLKEMRIRS